MTGSQMDIEQIEGIPLGLLWNRARRASSRVSTSPKPDEHRNAVIEAEVIHFGPSEVQQLTPLLRRFIEQYRESNVPADLVAVGSAIRKFIAVASRDDAFDFAAGLLLKPVHSIAARHRDRNRDLQNGCP